MASAAGVGGGHLVGVGTMRDVTNGILYPGYQVINFTADFEEVAIPDGNYNLNTLYWALMSGFSGSVEWHRIDASLTAAMLGGSVTDGAGIDSVVEEFTVPAPAGPYTVTLTEATAIPGSIVNSAVILVGAADEEIRCKVVAGAPAASGEVQVAANVLTFNVADASLEGTCRYLFTDAVGRTIDIPPNAIPTQIEAYLEIMLYVDDQELQPCIIHAKKLNMTGPFSMTGPRGDHEALSRDFRINNKVAGDLTVYMR